jgi:hypothetical protein
MWLRGEKENTEFPEPDRASPSKRRFCHFAVWKMGYPGAEVARYLGVTTSSVDRLAVSDGVADLKKYSKML